MLTRAADWEYRTEGNNHVIFSNIVTGSLLRLSKIPKHRRKNTAEKNEEQFMEIEFLETVIYKMLENCRIHFKAEKVALSQTFVDDLSRNMNDKRPMQFGLDALDDRCTYGLTMPNFCDRVVHTKTRIDHLIIPHSPVVSIEIRPKSCYVPHLSENAPSALRNKCYFCLMRIYAKNCNPSKARTRYCPHDLYSNDKSRMKRALCDLMASPKRYFSVRIDDEPIESGHNASGDPEIHPRLSAFLDANDNENELEAFLNLVCAILLTPITNQTLLSKPNVAKPHCRRGADSDTQRDAGNDVTRDVAGSNVMQVLACIQDMRDLPMSEVMKADERVRTYTDCNPEDRDLLSLDFPYSVDNWKCALDFTKREHEFTPPLDDAQETEKSEMVALVAQLRRFIVSRIFSCCSLIISMQKVTASDVEENGLDEKSFVVNDGFGNSYLSSIAILDLYKDPPNQITKYYENELHILSLLVQHYKKLQIS